MDTLSDSDIAAICAGVVQRLAGEGDESLDNTETEEITRARMLL
jgi:hypothetical protein